MTPTTSPAGTAPRPRSWLRGNPGDPDRGGLAAELAEVERAPGDAGHREVRRGELLAELGRTDEAFEAARAAIRLDPEDVESWALLGALEIKVARWDDVERTAARILELDPTRAAAHANRCFALRRLGRVEEAVAAGRRAVEVDPAEPVGYEYLAYAHLAADDCAAAYAVCEAALAVDPRNVTCLALSASALDGIGRRDAGRELMDFERLVWMASIRSPPEYASVAAFNEDLVALARATRSRPLDDTQTMDLFVHPSPPIAAFRRLVEQALDHYLRHIGPARGHPFVERMPGVWDIEGWATRLAGMGEQEHHFHPHGWVSGVYYAKMPTFVGRPEQGMAGFLEFCRFHQHAARPVESEMVAIPPREGLMVLFPSYFYHRIAPFSGQESRISVAFNLIPND